MKGIVADDNNLCCFQYHLQYNLKNLFSRESRKYRTFNKKENLFNNGFYLFEREKALCFKFSLKLWCQVWILGSYIHCKKVNVDSKCKCYKQIIQIKHCHIGNIQNLHLLYIGNLIIP